MTINIDNNLNIFINGKIVYFTIHVMDEIDKYEKDTLFACNVVDKGEKKRASKKEKRYESRLEIGDTRWIVVWFGMDDKILVKHFGKEKR